MDPSPYRIGVLSDTHSYLAPQIVRIFEGVDLILHSGDIGREDLLVELEALAPLRAVSGNVDGVPRPDRPLIQKFATPLGRIAMTHGHLTRASAYSKHTLVDYFSEFGPDVIVFGHTHAPHHSRQGRVTLFNPGVAGRARTGHGQTVGLITSMGNGAPPRFEHVVLTELT